MPLALTPNLKEDNVSAAFSKEGEQQMIKAVLAVPPNESCIASYRIGHRSHTIKTGASDSVLEPRGPKKIKRHLRTSCP